MLFLLLLLFCLFVFVYLFVRFCTEHECNVTLTSLAIAVILDDERKPLTKQLRENASAVVEGSFGTNS